MGNVSGSMGEANRLALVQSTELAELQMEEAKTLLLKMNVQPNREDFAALVVALTQVLATNFQSTVIARTAA